MNRRVAGYRTAERIVRGSLPMLLLIFIAPAALAQQAGAPGPPVQPAGLYTRYCSSCHDRPDPATRAPSVESLRERTPEAILAALTTGAMSFQARALTEGQRRALALYLSGRAFGAAGSGAASTMPNRCEAKPAGNLLAEPSWNGWGNGVANLRFQPKPGFTADQVPKLTLKWAFGLPNAMAAYGQPTIIGGRVYLGSDAGVVYAIDATSGCVYWSFEARAGVRTAISVGPVQGGTARYAVYFGDIRNNVYAVDAETGRGLWTVRVETFPLSRLTGAPTLHAGRLYVPLTGAEEGAASDPKYECCRFRGSVVALDAATGRQIWKSYTIPTAPKPTKKTSVGTQLYGPSGAGVWSAPTIDVKRGLLYVATSDAYSHPVDDSSDAIVAFDLKTGRRLWSRQLTENDAYIYGCEGPNGGLVSETCPDPLGPDFDFGSSPILVTLTDGRTILTAGQKSGIAWGLDPDREGKILWQRRVGKGGTAGGVQWGPAVDGERAYFATSDQHLGRDAGGLSAVNLADGSLVWSVKPPCPAERPCRPAQSAAITVIPGVVFSGTVDGMMRAYSTDDGRVLWEFNTAREFETVNRVTGKGGALNGPGPVVAGGMLFFASGYAGGAGNVLLAFTVQP